MADLVPSLARLYASSCGHTEKFNASRASLTWLLKNQDTGATWLYHGHWVV